jgi:hypothetical protein
MKRIVNCETGEVIEREETAEEIAEYKIKEKAELTRIAAEKAEAEAKAVEKAALLERLGITADEAKLLLS